MKLMRKAFLYSLWMDLSIGLILDETKGPSKLNLQRVRGRYPRCIGVLGQGGGLATITFKAKGLTWSFSCLGSNLSKGANKEYFLDLGSLFHSKMWSRPGAQMEKENKNPKSACSYPAISYSSRSPHQVSRPVFIHLRGYFVPEKEVLRVRIGRNRHNFTQPKPDQCQRSTSSSEKGEIKWWLNPNRQPSVTARNAVVCVFK